MTWAFPLNKCMPNVLNSGPDHLRYPHPNMNYIYIYHSVSLALSLAATFVWLLRYFVCPLDLNLLPSSVSVILLGEPATLSAPVRYFCGVGTVAVIIPCPHATLWSRTKTHLSGPRSTGALFKFVCYKFSILGVNS